MAAVVLSKGERARESILEAAHKLLIQQGFAATSMRQIGKAAGLAPGSLYNHFASKEEMFLAILKDRHPFYQIIPILLQVEGRTVEEFCRNAAHTLVENLGHHPDFLNLMLTEIVEFKGEHVPVLFETFLPELIPLGQRITSLDGKIRDVHPLVLMRAFLGMFFAYYITGILMGRAPIVFPEDALDQFVDIFLYGVLEEETA